MTAGRPLSVPVVNAGDRPPGHLETEDLSGSQGTEKRIYTAAAPSQEKPGGLAAGISWCSGHGTLFLPVKPFLVQV